MPFAEQFEVFYDDAFEPLIVASFDALQDAEAAMHDWASHVPGHYFVWCSRKDELVMQITTRLDCNGNLRCWN